MANLNTLSSFAQVLPQFRKKFRMRPPGPVTALELDGPLLRVAQTAQRITRTVVTRVAVAPLEFPADADRTDPAVLGKAIAQALSKLRLRPGPVVMGVPRAQVILRSLTLPLINDVRELASMVHLQIGKDLPFALEEAVVDFKLDRRIAAAPLAGAGGDTPSPAGEDAGPRVEVLVAATKLEVVEFYQRVAEAAGVNLIALGWLSSANARCLQACRSAEEGEVVGLISLRPEEMGIDVVADQRLLFSRGVTVKPNAPAEPGADAGAAAVPAAEPGPAPALTPEAYVEAVVIEAVRSLHSYGSMEPRAHTAKLVISGATGREAAVAEALHKRLNLPCAVLDLVQALDLPEPAREHSPGAISAIGLALGAMDSQGLPFDFLNPKRPAVQRNLLRIRLVMGAAAALALLLLLFGIQHQLKRGREAVHAKLKAELDGAVKNRAVYTRMRRQASMLQNWSAEGKSWLEHLAYLSAVLPASEEIYLTSVSVGSQGTIKLAVQARSGNILAQLEKKLRAAGYEVRPFANMPATDRTGFNFRSSVELIVPVKMKMDLAKVHPPPRPLDDISLEGGKPGRKGGSRE